MKIYLGSANMKREDWFRKGWDMEQVAAVDVRQTVWIKIPLTHIGPNCGGQVSALHPGLDYVAAFMKCSANTGS